MRHQLILPFDKDALPAYYDEEDRDRDPLYPCQPLPTFRRPVVTVNIVNIRGDDRPGRAACLAAAARKGVRADNFDNFGARQVPFRHREKSRLASPRVAPSRLGAEITPQPLLDDPDDLAVAEHLAHRAVLALGRCDHRLLVVGRQHVLFLDDDAARLGQLVDSIMLHMRLPGPSALCPAGPSKASTAGRRQARAASAPSPSTWSSSHSRKRLIL